MVIGGGRDATGGDGGGGGGGGFSAGGGVGGTAGGVGVGAGGVPVMRGGGPSRSIGSGAGGSLGDLLRAFKSTALGIKMREEVGTAGGAHDMPDEGIARVDGLPACRLTRFKIRSRTLTSRAVIKN